MGHVSIAVFLLWSYFANKHEYIASFLGSKHVCKVDCVTYNGVRLLVNLPHISDPGDSRPDSFKPFHRTAVLYWGYTTALINVSDCQVTVKIQYSPRYILGFVFLIARSLNWLVLFIYSHSSGWHSHYFTSASKLTLRNLFQIGHHQTAKSPALYMMTSSNGHMFLFTGPLWGEATGHQWIPLKRIPNKRLSKQSICWWFETQLRPVWRHCNVTHSN